MSHTATVRILDRTYDIACTPDTEAKLHEAATLLNKRLSDLRVGHKLATNDKLIVLCALNLAHEVMAQRQELAHDSDHLNQLIGRISQSLDHTQSLLATHN